MGSQYTSVSVSNYNANPPSDDGSATEANRLYWSTIKTKLTDMLKTAIEGINTNIVAAFGKVEGGVTTTAISYQVVSGDQGKLVKATASGITVTTPDAASVGSPFVFDFLNASDGDVTLEGSGVQTIDGDANITVPAGYGVRIRTDGTNWFTNGQNFPTVVIYPPKAQYSNLVIKVTGNTGVDVTADAITVTDGTTALMLTGVSHSINMATTGANALDSGSIAQATWYAIWEIAKADGTKAALASTSFSSPTMPTDYIHKARIGAVRTAAASAQLLGTWQFGNKVRYKVGLAQCSALPLIDSGAKGTYHASSNPLTFATASVSNFVPSTASVIAVRAQTTRSAGAASFVYVAPNANYGGFQSTNPCPYFSGDSGAAVSNEGGPFDILLESTNLSWVSSAAGGALVCYGWEDNL